jgi:signal transduction histidine kinase
MQIRTKLTLQFLLLGGMIMIIASVSIWFTSARLRNDDFYTRLRNSARITARMVLDSDETGAVRGKPESSYPIDLQNEKIIIIDYLNDTIYNNDTYGDIEIRNDLLERVRLYGRMSERQGNYLVLGTLYSTPLYRYVVIAGATDLEGEILLRKLAFTLTGVCIASLLLFALAGWIFAGRALKPITDVVKKVDAITISSINLRVPEGNGTDELGRLARTFNNMLARLENSFTVQKDFIANASHELRTPLTSINGQLDVLLMKDRPADDYKAAVQSVKDDIRSLISLTNKLLLMARAGSEPKASYNMKIRTDEVLWQARDDMKRTRNDAHINISIDESLTDAEQMLVAGDEDLLRTAFLNIIDNACKYSSDNTVYIRIENSGSAISIFFIDNGIGIPKDDLKKIFEPFYRAGDVHGHPGSGIGLALVNQIIKNHKGTIEISSEKGKGTTVKVSLPVIKVSKISPPF